MVTDLAETMPETADKLTYIVKIRPNVRFHDTQKARASFPQVAGRQLTAEDVKYSIERQIDRDSSHFVLCYRSFQWDTLERIEMPDGPDGLTLKFVTKRPTAAFVHYLGDTNAFIVAKELVDPDRDDMNNLDKMIGTGPFYLDRFVALQVSRCARNSDWFAKDDLAAQGLPNRPIVDAIEAIWPPQDDAATEVAFASKQVDNAFYVDSYNAERIVREMGVDRTRNVNTGWVNSRLLIADSEKAVSPFKDLRVRKALHLAMDRSRMGQQMFGGPFFVVCPPISLSLKQWAYTPEELAKKPGYRFRREERDEDLAEAKRLWEAGGGAELGEIELLVAGIPDYVKNQAPQMQRTLAEVLGMNVKPRVDASGYTELAQAALEKRGVFSLNFDNGWLDPDDWLFAYFHSNGPKNSFNLTDPTLDQMLEDQRAEFDMDKRRQLVLGIQDYLLENVVARLDYVAPSQPNTKWPYMRNKRVTPWFGDWYLWPPNLWLDTADPNFQGRPA
jgi:peptide/nickel transport system substrate-binding protein